MAVCDPCARPRFPTLLLTKLHQDEHESEQGDRTPLKEGSEAGSYLRRIDFVYHSTLGLRVIKKKVEVV